MPRGKKECPECGELLGPRTKECPKCEHKFAIKTGGSSRRKPPPRRRAQPPRPPEADADTPIPVSEQTPCETISDVRIRVKLTSQDEAKAFLDQLRDAVAKALHGGGVYAAFLHCKTGVVEIDVSFPHSKENSS